MKNYKKLYRDLETSILHELRVKAMKSKTKSKHFEGNVIPVNLFDYTELGVINDRLVFLDKNGNHYGLFSDAKLDDLIDILNTKK